MHVVGTALGMGLGMGLVGGAMALTVAVGPVQADPGHGNTGTRTHDRKAHDSAARPAKPHRHDRAVKSSPQVAPDSSPKTEPAAKPDKAVTRRDRMHVIPTAAAQTDPSSHVDRKAERKAERSSTGAPVSVAPAVTQTATSTTSLRAASAQVETAATAVGAGSAATVTTASTATAHAPTLLNVVGTLLFNALGAVMQWFAGKPVLPKGSTVTVKVTSMTMPDTGQKVNTDWYFPENANESTRLIYFQHGFMAVNSMYSYTLAALAERTNSIIVAPTLSSNAFDVKAQWLGGSADQQAVADLFVGDRAALTASAHAAGFEGTLPTSFVLMGHSLGGALVTSAAGYLVDNGAVADLKGVVLLDSVDLNNVVPTALAKLTGVNYRPVYDISSEPYVWNIDGLVGQELEAARPGQFNGVMLQGGRHIDGLQGANPLLQGAEYLIAGASWARNVAAEKDLAAGWINDMFAGTHDGIYGSPHQTIEIPTSAGDATAVAFPFSSTTPIRATPWDGIAKVILDTVLQFAVYEPLAGAGAATQVTTSV